MKTKRVRCMMIFFLTLLSVFGRAQDNTYYTKPFVMNWSLQPDSLDPHFRNLVANNTLSAHIFDPLYAQKEGVPVPVLVQSHEVETPTRWRFNLKKKCDVP